MRSLSTEEREEALKYINWVAFKRDREGKSEDTIARELEFPSAPRMYQRMEELECPRWAIYPETPKKRRRAWGKDPTSDEIPITDFLDRFEEGVQKLKEALEEVPYLKQWLKDGRFVSQLHYPKESGRASPRVYRKEDMVARGYAGLWEDYCKKHGCDPDETEQIRVPREDVLDCGADRHPDPYLVCLTAAYALTGGTLPDLPKVEEKREALLRAARHLTTTLLGGQVGAGVPREPISAEEQEAARLVQWAAQHGGFDAATGAITNEKWLSPEERNLAPEEIKRLLSLQLPDAKKGASDAWHLIRKLPE
jgi:hypothetical protein